MLEILFDMGDEERVETKLTERFSDKYIDQSDEDMGDEFFAAIRESRFEGYREGMAAALKLFAECGLKA